MSLASVAGAIPAMVRQSTVLLHLSVGNGRRLDESRIRSDTLLRVFVSIFAYGAAYRLFPTKHAALFVRYDATSRLGC
jgi:hypothetical protein